MLPRAGAWNQSVPMKRIGVTSTEAMSTKGRRLAEDELHWRDGRDA